MKHCGQMSGPSASEPPAPADADVRAARRRSRLGKVLTWAVAISILSYLGATIPAQDLGDALSRTSLWLLLPLTVGFVLSLLVADATAMWVGFRAALPDIPLRMKPVLLIRGASYLLAVLSYSAGQGGIIYFLRREHGVPLSRATGAVLLTSGAFVIVLASVMGIGLLSGQVPDRPELRVVALLVMAATPVYLAVVALRPRFLARWQILKPFFDAEIWGTVRIVAARGLHTAVLLAGHWTAMRVFGVDVPLDVALTRLPVLFVVGALPISPSGLGTTQAAAMTLFAEFAPGATESARAATVFAYSLSFHVCCMVGSALTGLICLRALTGSVMETTNPDRESAPNPSGHDFDSGADAS